MLYQRSLHAFDNSCRQCLGVSKSAGGILLIFAIRLRQNKRLYPENTLSYILTYPGLQNRVHMNKIITSAISTWV